MVTGRPKVLRLEIRLLDNLRFVFAALEHNEIVITINLRERLHEPQDILPNAGLMIIDESGVYANPQFSLLLPSDYTRA